MKQTLIALGLTLGVISASPASAQAAAPTTAPATQPATLDEKIKALVSQLGAEDFQLRERAAEDLRKIGRPAIPALKEAARNPDPEIQARATDLAKELDGTKAKKQQQEQAQARPGLRQPIFVGPPGVMRNNVRIEVRANGQVQKSVTTVNSSREINIDENGYKVHIHEDGDGLKMSVTEKVDGKDVTKEYKAKNADELKKNDPEAFKIYEKYTANDGLKLDINIEELINDAAPARAK